MWSSGQDPAFSPPWPGFDSPHGSQEGQGPVSKQGSRAVQRGHVVARVRRAGVAKGRSRADLINLILFLY